MGKQATKTASNKSKASKATKQAADKAKRATAQRPTVVGYRDGDALRAAIVTWLGKHGTQSSRQIVTGLGRNCGQAEGQPVVDACKALIGTGELRRIEPNPAGDRCQYAFALAGKAKASKPRRSSKAA